MKHWLSLLLALWPLAAMANDVPSTADAIVTAARASIEARLGAMADEASLEVTGRPAGPWAAMDARTVFRAVPVVGRFPRERFTVDVALVRAGVVVGKATVVFALRLPSQAWVYGHDGHTHDDVDALALERRTVDAAGARSGFVTDPASLDGLRLKRSVRQGQPVSMADFERVPDVDNRQAVRLRASFGDIVLESAGTALRAGNRGDVVTVQIAGGTTPVKATVIERGVAELVQ
jgi:flagella basal body P-ring formation protein FlgA